MTVTFTVDGNPIPKARPRVTRGHTYTPQRTKTWEAAVGWAYLNSGANGDFDGDVAVRMRFYRQTRHRVDLDNLVKAVLDGLNGVAYPDDDCVKRLDAALDYDRERPRVEVTLEAIPAKKPAGGKEVDH
jgi:Holliday junction resolvase RusA-like endonuclease